jgi:hypothetical protein
VSAGIVASNYKAIGRNTLIGSADLTILAWRFTFFGCTWHKNHIREWVNFPGREYFDRTGTKQYAALGQFTDDTIKARFQVAGLAAFHAIATQQPGGVPAPSKGDQT